MLRGTFSVLLGCGLRSLGLGSGRADGQGGGGRGLSRGAEGKHPRAGLYPAHRRRRRARRLLANQRQERATSGPPARSGSCEGTPHPGRPSLLNIVSIISKEWIVGRGWVRRQTCLRLGRIAYRPVRSAFVQTEGSSLIKLIRQEQSPAARSESQQKAREP